MLWRKRTLNKKNCAHRYKNAKSYTKSDRKKYNQRQHILFEENKKDKYYYEPIRISSAFEDNFIEYESNDEKDKTLPIEEYLDKIRPYLSNMINDHKTDGKWKI